MSRELDASLLRSSVNQKQWAIHPQPCEDELLESWLIRLAQANHISSRWLIGGLLRLENALSGQDHIPDNAFDQLAGVSGVPQSRILEAHLATFARYRNLVLD